MHTSSRLPPCPVCEGKLPPDKRELVAMRRANRLLREQLAEAKLRVMQLEGQLEGLPGWPQGARVAGGDPGGGDR